MHLFKSTVVVMLPNGGPASSGCTSHSADNVLLSKLKLLHCLSGRLVGGEMKCLDDPEPTSKLSRPMRGDCASDEIGVEEACRLK
jgi:hypothetical protein